MAKAIEVKRGDEWCLGDAKFSVRWPPKLFRLPDPNMLSIVLRVNWNKHELWFMGDALGLQERDLIDLGEPGLWSGQRLLKAGHHGGATATSQQWIDTLRPQTVLFTAESPNRFGFPNPSVLSRCRDANANILITGSSKGLKLEAEADGWIVYPSVLGL
jgi:competence protein ComEC